MTTARADVRRAARDTRQPLIGGVAMGLARHLALPVLWVRAAFVATAAMGGLGIAFYAGLWVVLPADTHFENTPPGLAGATRGGRRPGTLRRMADAGPAIALMALAFGAILLIQAVLGRGVVFWPMAIAVAGVALLWRQADEVQRERWLDTSGRLDPVRAVFGRGGWAAYARVAVGVALVVAALALFNLRSGSFAMARDVTAAALLTLVGFGVVVGPWFYRLATDLSAERAERVRSQERSDVAAHLHDSVLQTLALIQQSADNGPVVARLARAQERDLRAWLYAGEFGHQGDDRTVASALRLLAAQIEDTHGVSVEVVTVGDCDLLDALRPVVAAAGEAVTNAAKHAGTGHVDVYAEVSPESVDVYVRDRGEGFDPQTSAADRHGIRDSIIGRMARHGGSADVRSTPGEGTEVRLHQPRVLARPGHPGLAGRPGPPAREGERENGDG